MFYTNVSRRGSNLLVRGYDNGRPFKEKVDFQPSLFVKSKSPTEYKAFLTGEFLQEIKPGSMYDSKVFLDKYKDVEGFEIHGQTDYVIQYIAQKYSREVPWNYQDIKVVIIDIETETEYGFPNIDLANEAVQLITVTDAQTKESTTFGLKEFVNPDPGEYKVNYVHCQSERELLNRFINLWRSAYPDVVTGWNVEFFDLPYLIRRIENVLGDDASKQLSPWGFIDEREVLNHGKKETIYDIVGVSTLDYLALYKKFTFKARASYKLDSIGEIELKMNKLKNPYKTFKDFYSKDFSLFTCYNFIDVDIVLKLDEKLSLIQLIMSIAYDAKINYLSVFSPVNTWDAIIYNHLLKTNVVIPPRKNSISSTFEGGFVMDPVTGLHEWIVSFDATSLYPSIIQSWNISPETFIGIEDGVSIDRMVEGKVEYDKPYSLCSNGAMFKRDEKGVLGELIDHYMGIRSTAKKEMLKKKSQIEGMDKNSAEYKSIKTDISVLNNKQGVVKVLNNSLFGACGNAYFRYYNRHIACAITHNGQTIIRMVGDGINTKLNKLMKTEGVQYLIYSDTDSIYLNLKEVVDRAYPGKTTEQTVKFLDRLCEEKITPMINEICTELQEKTKAYRHNISFKREAISDKGIFVAKKKYGLNVYNNEGVQYSEPELKIMGLQMIQSSTPPKVAEILTKALSVVLQGSQDELQKFVKESKDTFEKLKPADIAKTVSANNLDKFNSSNSIYTKGCPYNVRGALLYNHYIEKNNLKDVYPLIKEGEKVKIVYLMTPNPIQENLIAFLDEIPEEFGLDKYVDYDTQFEKVFADAVETIITVLKWSLEPIANLEDFFG